MKAPTLLLACCLIAVLDAADEGQYRRRAASRRRASQSGRARDSTASTAAASPATRSCAALCAFFDRRLDGLDGNGRSCADCHMATDNFQLSPASAEARFQLLQRRRRLNPDADDPLFRPIDADDFRINGESASDFSNLRENGLVRITFTLPPNIRLIDPATNPPSAETFVDVWRSVPTVNDVALTGPDDGNPWPRGPNATGGYQLDARVATLQEQALGALTNHAQVQNAPPQQTARRPGLVSAGAVHESSCARALRRHRGGHGAVAGSRSAARRARAAGQGRVRARLRPVPRRARGQSTPPARRSFDFTTSRASVRVRLMP